MARTKSEVARTKVLTSASALVLEVGLHGFSVDEVCRQSGVAKTTIYRHFTREELLMDAIDACIPVPNVPDTGSLRGDLEEFLPEVLPIFANDAIRVIFFEIWAAASRSPELAQAYGAMMARRSVPTRTIYDNARTRSEIAPGISYIDAFAIMEGPFMVRSLTNPASFADLDLAAVIDRILVQLLH